ncbi:MAG TPA: hypothetical protein VMP01_18090 [Pirellulaceae bacterium]|nr:hypothetical protein [Pirellulaceae bacterium]
MAKQADLDDTQEIDLSQVSGRLPRAIFQFRIGNKAYEMNYQQAFSYGHRLLKKQHFETAALIFNKLSSVAGRGPRAHIMLAICLAGCSNYQGSREVLDSVFRGEEAILAAELQDVIVMARMGFSRDALQDLVKLVNNHKELPSLCLWLGDLLEASQQMDKARQCWRLAVDRDGPKGAVATAARKQLRQRKAKPRRKLRQRG